MKIQGMDCDSSGVTQNGDTSDYGAVFKTMPDDIFNATKDELNDEDTVMFWNGRAF
jgi:hypothetical protein